MISHEDLQLAADLSVNWVTYTFYGTSFTDQLTGYLAPTEWMIYRATWPRAPRSYGTTPFEWIPFPTTDTKDTGQAPERLRSLGTFYLTPKVITQAQIAVTRMYAKAPY